MAEPLSISLSKDASKLLLHVTDKTAVAIPMNDLGMVVLRKIMLERSAIAHALIATPAAPIQHMVEKWLLALAAGHDVTVVTKKKAPSNLTLEDLGL